MSAFVVAQSKLKLYYLHKGIYTDIFCIKKYVGITLLELQSRGPLRMSKVSSECFFLNFIVSLADSHTPHNDLPPHMV